MSLLNHAQVRKLATELSKEIWTQDKSRVSPRFLNQVEKALAHCIAHGVYNQEDDDRMTLIETAKLDRLIKTGEQNFSKAENVLKIIERHTND